MLIFIVGAKFHERHTMSKREIVLLSMFVLIWYIVSLAGCYKDAKKNYSWYFDEDVIWEEVP